MQVASAALPTSTGWYAIPNSALRTVCPPFAVSSSGGLLLDIDEIGPIDGPSDGLLILRYRLGCRPSPDRRLIGKDTEVVTATAISDYLSDIEPLLDIDGDGTVDPRTDGLLISRYLRGLRKNAFDFRRQ